jgi:hypothetical protein
LSEVHWSEYRGIELAKYAALEDGLLRSLYRPRPIVVRGKVVVDPVTREPLFERGPDLAVVDRLLRLANRVAKVLGVDAPPRRAVQVITTELLDEAVRSLEVELGIPPGAPIPSR